MLYEIASMAAYSLPLHVLLNNSILDIVRIPKCRSTRFQTCHLMFLLQLTRHLHILVYLPFGVQIVLLVCIHLPFCSAPLLPPSSAVVLLCQCLLVFHLLQSVLLLFFVVSICVAFLHVAAVVPVVSVVFLQFLLRHILLSFSYLFYSFLPLVHDTMFRWHKCPYVYHYWYSIVLHGQPAIPLYLICYFFLLLFFSSFYTLHCFLFLLFVVLLSFFVNIVLYRW
mmetsp:Transcript_8670/g.12811  ORF Transcript_8670/g.12811 Transcript_8670/m.12811 type:complete len:224 (-) Transcript_8670:86-757(-)